MNKVKKVVNRFIWEAVISIQVRVGKKGVKSYRVRIRGSDSSWVTKSFRLRKDAEAYDSSLTSQGFSGAFISNSLNGLVFKEFSEQWKEKCNNKASEGWKKSQDQMMRDYILPVIGEMRLKEITGIHIISVLKRMTDMGRSQQMVLHVYSLLNKIFGDAVSEFEYLTRNPVKKSQRPVLMTKEAEYLEIDELKKLLLYSLDKKYYIALWLQGFVGLRAGEVQALKWKDLDLEKGLIHVRGTFARKENIFRDFTKGKKCFINKLPRELWDLLLKVKGKAFDNDYVVKTGDSFMSYQGYYKALKKYAKEAGIEKTIGTHTLRHSTSLLYLQNGATRDDVQSLFSHSSLTITERYLHDTEFRSSQLAQVADSIRLFD